MSKRIVMKRIVASLGVVLCGCGVLAGDQPAGTTTVSTWPANHPLNNLKPGEWYEASNSLLSAVAPPSPGGGGVAGVIGAWGGGAYDTRRDRLMVWGGGHGDYAGNEVYAFDVRTLKWLRLNEPSKDVGGVEGSGVYPDGNPRSVHTYNYIFYIPPPFDRFCASGTAGTYPSGQCGSDRFWCFDLETNKWEARGLAPGRGIGAFTAVDSSNNHVWAHGTASSPCRLTEFDPQTGKWEFRSGYDNEIQYNYGLTMDLDPVRKLLIAVGWGVVYKWDVSVPGTLKKEKLETTGVPALLKGQSPGFAFHPPSRMFAAWGGGADVYLFDPDTLVWRKAPLAATNKVIPTQGAATGTYGRFRYIPSKDVFVVVNGVNENVYFFRLPVLSGIAK